MGGTTIVELGWSGHSDPDFERDFNERVIARVLEELANRDIKDATCSLDGNGDSLTILCDEEHSEVVEGLAESARADLLWAADDKAKR